ncbi:uncharacterized protein LOC101854234 [Aplysia californica]|uniref:Uncharacterized protein LOC101854234 n=1 Tax=Aplysia californica TaxID=6500 RepID=A0ABM0JES9_APLCA|nr:uncharacterized protein LOC101854234 [Aplysia californica]
MEGCALCIMLVVVIVDIVMTFRRCCKKKWFLGLSMLCLLADMLSIASVLIAYQCRMDLGKIFPNDRLYTGTDDWALWAFKLACFNVVIVNTSAIVTFLARNSGNER